MNLLVTGASRGLGKAISEELRNCNYNLVLPTRSELDLSNEKSIEKYFMKKRIINGIVFNAGINEVAPINDIKIDTYEKILNTNLKSTLLILKNVLPNMIDQRFGRIVFISSTYASRGREGRSLYSISKSGLESLSRSVALEFAKYGILANCIAPGFIDTELTRKNNSEIEIEKLTERIPIARLGTVHEIAVAVKFLISPENTYITGQVINVDGGFSIT